MSVRFAVGGKSKTLYLNIVLHPLSGERIRFHLVMRRLRVYSTRDWIKGH